MIRRGSEEPVVNIGDSVDLITKEHKGKGPFKFNKDERNPANAIERRRKKLEIDTCDIYIHNKESKSFSITPKVSLPSSIPGVALSLTGEYLKEESLDSERICLVAKAEFITHDHTLPERFQLSSDASVIDESAMNTIKSDPEGFVKNYGSGYVTSAAYGNAVYVFISYSQTSTTNKETIKAALEAGLKEAKISAEHKKTLDLLKQNESLRISIKGVGVDPSLQKEMEALESKLDIQKLRNFVRTTLTIAPEKGYEKPSSSQEALFYQFAPYSNILKISSVSKAINNLQDQVKRKKSLLAKLDEAKATNRLHVLKEKLDKLEENLSPEDIEAMHLKKLLSHIKNLQKLLEKFNRYVVDEGVDLTTLFKEFISESPDASITQQKMMDKLLEYLDRNIEKISRAESYIDKNISQFQVEIFRNKSKTMSGSRSYLQYYTTSFYIPADNGRLIVTLENERKEITPSSSIKVDVIHKTENNPLAIGGTKICKDIEIGKEVKFSAIAKNKYRVEFDKNEDGETIRAANYDVVVRVIGQEALDIDKDVLISLREKIRIRKAIPLPVDLASDLEKRSSQMSLTSTSVVVNRFSATPSVVRPIPLNTSSTSTLTTKHEDDRSRVHPSFSSTTIASEGTTVPSNLSFLASMSSSGGVATSQSSRRDIESNLPSSSNSNVPTLSHGRGS